METCNTDIETPGLELVSSSPPQPAAPAQLGGIERTMADALIALDTPVWGLPSDRGAIEYASWLRLLRRATA